MRAREKQIEIESGKTTSKTNFTNAKRQVNSIKTKKLYNYRYNFSLYSRLEKKQ